MSFSLQSVSAWISSRLSKTCDTAPVHTRIRLYSNTHIQAEPQVQLLQVHQALPENVWCKHWTWQTTNTTLHKHKQAKENNIIKRKFKKGTEHTPTETDATKSNNPQTDTNKHTNYWTPSTCCIAHTCSKTRETAVYGINTVSEEKSFYNVSVDDGTRRQTAKEDGEIVQNYGGKKSNKIDPKYVLT